MKLNAPIILMYIEGILRLKCLTKIKMLFILLNLLSKRNSFSNSKNIFKGIKTYVNKVSNI